MSDHSDAPVATESLRADETGIASGLTLSDLARPRIRSRSALLVAVAVGVSLFVLVASAFSVAAESRVVATKSNQLHSCDEVLRSAITARSQLGSALNFAQLDLSEGTDSSRVIDSAVGDSRRSLEDMAGATGCVATGGESGVMGSDFAETASRAADFIAAGGPENIEQARVLVVGDMDSQYTELVEQLIDERQTLVDSLTEADENLGRLGALATFIIAFFVPTVAMFVYRQITRRQRETIELARLLSEARAGNDWRSDLIHSAAAMAQSEAGALPVSSMTTSLRSRLHDLDFLVGATALGQGYTFEALTVAQIREELQAAWPNLVSVAGDGSDILWGDRRAILLLCNDIVRNARHRGAERVLISGGVDADGVWLAVTDNGEQVNRDAVDAILQSPSLMDATDEHFSNRLDSDTSLVLILGRMIAPALGGSFWSDSVGTNTRCTLRLPSARLRKTAAPKLTSAR